MTTSDSTRAGSSVAYGSPIGAAGPRVPLWDAKFAADPHSAYARMRRQFGSLVPVELAQGIPATLVVGYRVALRILNDPVRFPADPRAWQETIPPDCEILPMLEYQPNALRTSGAPHDRYRAANTVAIGGVDVSGLHSLVEGIAIPLINGFCERGQADLLQEYAFPLVFQVLNRLMGCDAGIAGRIAEGMAAMFDAVDAVEGNRILCTAVSEHVARKRAETGDDITSRLIAHAAGLDDDEMLHQIVTLFALGQQPLVNLIGNALLLMMTDERFGGRLVGGSLSVRDALDEVLFGDPPLANYCVSYPKQSHLVDDVWLPADQPVLISMAACNSDPEAVVGIGLTGNRAHLAFSVGDHACPARDLSLSIAIFAIEQFLDAIPEVRLGVRNDELAWRPGPFHRALAALPVTFPPAPVMPVMTR